MASTVQAKSANALVTLILDEFLDSSDAAEVAARLKDICSKDCSSVEVVKRAMYLVYDRTLSDGEKLASLLTQLCLIGAISTDEVERGLLIMAARLPDATLDNPRATEAISGVATWLILADIVDEEVFGPGHSGVVAQVLKDERIDTVTGTADWMPELHAILSRGLRSRENHPLTDIRGMQTEALMCYLASGGANFSDYVNTVARAESGLGDAVRYARHVLAQTLWRALLKPDEYEEAPTKAMSLPPKRPKESRASTDGIVTPGSSSGISSSVLQVPSRPLPLSLIRELVSQLMDELKATGLLGTWDIEVGATAVLYSIRHTASSKSLQSFGQAIARAVTDGLLPLAYVHRTFTPPSFTNTWARSLAAERIYTGEWVTVQYSALDADSTTPICEAVDNAARLLCGTSVGSWGWAGAPFKDVRKRAEELGKAIAIEVRTDGDGSIALSGLPALQQMCGGTDIGAAEMVRAVVVEGSTTDSPAPPSRLAAALASLTVQYDIAEPTLRIGVARALESAYNAGRGATCVNAMGDTIGHMIRMGIIAGGYALWERLPRALLLAAKLETAAGEDGIDYLSAGNAAAFLGAVRARAELVKA